MVRQGELPGVQDLREVLALRMVQMPTARRERDRPVNGHINAVSICECSQRADPERELNSQVKRAAHSCRYQSGSFSNPCFHHPVDL